MRAVVSAVLAAACLSATAGAQIQIRQPQVVEITPELIRPEIRELEGDSPAVVSARRRAQAAELREAGEAYLEDRPELAWRFFRAAAAHEDQAERIDRAPSLEEARSLIEANADASLHMVELQEAMQARARQYQMMSDVMKARHDAAMAIIRNMR